MEASYLLLANIFATEREQLLYGRPRVSSHKDFHPSSACKCHPRGAKNGACDTITGQCACRPNIALISDTHTNLDTVPSSNSNSSNGTTSSNSNSSSGTISSNSTTNSNSTSSSGSTSSGTSSSGIIISNSTAGVRSLVVDGTCSVCVANFFGVSSGVGCAQCGCSPQCSSGLQCDEAGQCPCKDSVTGLKCDSCKNGFFGLSSTGCSRCNCSETGLMAAECNQATGACTCKTNVQGDKCTQCKPGFFNLASYNPDGCQPCFCYGHGNSCNSSEEFETKLLQVTGPTSVIQSGPLLGDHHISYGLNITVHFSAGYLLDLYNETLILLTGNNKTIFHKGRNGTTIVPGQDLQYVIQLFESSWILLDTLQMPTAFDVMGILANLVEISLVSRVKGQPILVTYIELQSAVPRNKSITSGSAAGLVGSSVTFVEQCNCNPSHYVAGSSCEKCAIGYMRDNLTNNFTYGICKPCDCQGRGATNPPECNETTGLCLNCRNGTAGEHCEKCAPFVTGTNCDTCNSSFWGLQADGCRACNCSSPGSLSQVCDPQSGQCTCVSHVNGRTCDQCEENFQGISSTGCVECDSCYSLMTAEILPLRQFRSNIASNVTLLVTRNVTATLGPFMSRLKSAAKDTEQLINFLWSVNQSSSQINAKITALNQTLGSLRQQTSDTENATLSIEQGLALADAAVKQAMTSRATVETKVGTIHADIAILQTSVLDLGSLAGSLQSAESYLESLANASTADQEIIAYLATLNQTVSRAGLLINEMSLKSQEASRVHQGSTGSLLLLETMIISVMSKVIGTSSSAHNLATENNRNTATVERLQKVKAELIGYVVDYVTIASRTRSALSMSSSYQTQVTAETSLFTPSNLKALQSVSLLEPLINGTQNLSSASSLLLWRSNNSWQQSSIIKNEAQLFLTSAQSILATVANFSAEASSMKQKADESLRSLAALNNQSQVLISQATNMTDPYVVLKQDVSVTKDTSQQALLIVQDKYQKLVNVSNAAIKLQSRLQSLTSTSDERYKAVNSTAVSVVVPAQQLCHDLNKSVSDLRGKLVVAETTTGQALLTVSNVTERANQMLAALKGIQGVNTAAIVALIQQVATARANVDVESLRSIVGQLQVSSSVQRTEISRLTAVRDTLRNRVQNLQRLQAQIVSGV